MTREQKTMLVFTYTVANAAFVGVLLIVLHASPVWPGMVVALALSAVTGWLAVRSK